jgi:transcriptional regulator with XRE-family HTH domain
MTARLATTSYSTTVISRMRALRAANGMSQQTLADQLTDAGCPTSRGIIAALELGDRLHVTVDELYALATVFGVPIDRLTDTVVTCRRCGGHPPAGYRCLDCGAPQ